MRQTTWHSLKDWQWTTRGPALFSHLPLELFETTVTMAANQGTYNAFLATGLIWSLLIKDNMWQGRVALCFLIFVAIAGVVGALIVSMNILLVQSIPSTVAIVLVTVCHPKRR